MAMNGVIGREGEMPWRLKSDLKRYRQLTMGKPMIMGRKTLVSIGRVLDGRDSVVLSRGRELPFEGAHLADTAESAVAIADDLAGRRGAEEIAVVGGAEIYRLFLDRLVRLHVTHVEAEPEGDARFPPIDPRVWRLVRLDPALTGPGDSAPTRYALYERRA
ncbi:diacylglycerol kinase [Aureimonas sp. Leaf454]|nr:diacylglycerol kinase [Aureimonas sp. Leaf454]